MGSAGTDSFSDYSQTGGGDGGEKSGGGSSSAAASGPDQCERAHGDIALEEVARCEYFKGERSVPKIESKVAVRTKLEGGRLAVESTARKKQIIGYLPTRYLYLRKCIERGWSYEGHVIASSAGKAPIVRIDLAPSKRPKK